ncbi:MAG: alpha-galactosidase, partial [Myxococcales bacterium]|nr:alpha-galactosidase [Myxococcales bacterium]
PARDGREGFSLFEARCGNILARLAPAGKTQRSEVFRIDRFEGKPQAALEAYAHRLADRLGIAPPAHAPRAGWDSWYVYSDKINEAIITSNIDAARDRFVPYGLNTFEVDFGWEKVWGNWDERSGNFPDGMAALAARIRAAGMEPELWISAFNAHVWSRIGLEHPEWFAPRDPLWSLLMFFGTGPLDFTIPEVTDFIGGLGDRVAGWGWDAVKFDFAYYTFLVDAVRDRETTIIEGYRRALGAFRDAFGRDRFFINIFGMGANYGLVDSMRVGIDTWPCWGDDPAETCPHAPTTTGYSGQGIRPAVKTLARRYYFNDVVWVNHPDQVFFRPPLDFTPQRSWATLVGLSGGVVSLGDDMALLSEEGAEAYRRILPNLGRTAVPMDLFEREYPEVWLTRLDGLDPGGA